MNRPRCPKFEHEEVHGFVDELFGDDMHAKRVASLAGAVSGVLVSGSMAISAIGLGLAHVRGLNTKHSHKQVDRLIGNDRLDVWEHFAQWVPYLVGQRQEIMVAMDWSDFDRDKQTTIALNLLTDHGRAIPLLWKTVDKNLLKNHRNEYEDQILERLYNLIFRMVLV